MSATRSVHTILFSIHTIQSSAFTPFTPRHSPSRTSSQPQHQNALTLARRYGLLPGVHYVSVPDAKAVPEMVRWL